jgi:DNA-binding NtrC family response regulator
MRPSRAHDVLLIEPTDGWSLRLRDVVTRLARLKVCGDFHSARRQLSLRSFAFLITNIRLGEYNGLQLVYLAHDVDPRCRAIAYTAVRDVWLAREAQRAGAFYDTFDCLPITLPGFLIAPLPASDRRDPAQPDRRSSTRAGGRRAWDQHASRQHETGTAIGTRRKA